MKSFCCLMALIKIKINFITVYQIISQSIMAITSGQKTAFSICLVLTILLVGLHFSVAGTGHEYFKNDSDPNFNVSNTGGINYPERDFNQLAAFLIIAAGLTFFISIALLVGFCADRLTPRLRHILATLNLILQFAIAVSVSIAAAQASNRRDLLYNQLNQSSNNDLDLYYRLAIADAVITFVLEVVYLVIIFFGTLDEIEHTVVLTATIQNPPITADRLQ